MLDDVLKPKTDEEIEELMKSLTPEELLSLGFKMNDKNIILYGIEKANTKVWAYDYSEDFLKAVNTRQYWEFLDVNEEYITVKRIADGEEQDWSFKFFANQFTPIYADNRVLKETKDTINKIYKTF